MVWSENEGFASYGHGNDDWAVDGVE
jgi:hypothetical protein